MERQRKRVQVFQAQIELLQAIEQGLKEEMAALRETNAQLEFEKNETAAAVEQMGSKIEALKVN